MVEDHILAGWAASHRETQPLQPPQPEGCQAVANTLATPVAAAKAPAECHGTHGHVPSQAAPCSGGHAEFPCAGLSFHETPTALIIHLLCSTGPCSCMFTNTQRKNNLNTTEEQQSLGQLC